ncbi:MAG: hypothetical protein IT425_00780 [Pirellulales bacterium]|nr:hypothetical protein [Pirellulales bacterium]
MIHLSEPPPSPADLHFRLFGIPVRVHPLFWIVTVLLCIGGRRPVDPRELFVWVGVVFVSILIHELGHAVVQRYYGGWPWITLHGFGGLASCNNCDRRPRSQILISIAGPMAGFILAGFVISILVALGRVETFSLSWVPVQWELFGTIADIVVWDFLVVNILWGLVNLLPVYPLDGGQISRQLFFLAGTPERRSLQLSAGVAIAFAAYALLNQRFFVAFMFGMLAFDNFQTLQFQRGHWR